MPPKHPLTHLNQRGEAHMVDVGAKPPTKRRAVAQAVLQAETETINVIMADGLKKGDALATARIAGIMGAKNTSNAIPLCHPVALSHVEVEITRSGDREIQIMVVAETTGPTGVEMEALNGASVAALTLYDMAKALDRAMVISDLRLNEKSGGKSGAFSREGSEL